MKYDRSKAVLRQIGTKSDLYNILDYNWIAITKVFYQFSRILIMKCKKILKTFLSIIEGERKVIQRYPYQ